MLLLLWTVKKVTKLLGQMDYIYMEAFMFGGHRLHVYLSILFNIFLKYGYVPNEFCRSVIIPLIKNKTADLTDANNYRAIALSNAVTKILKTCCSLSSNVVMMLMITSLVSESGTRLLLVLVYLKILLTTIVSMVVMYSVVLLTLQKPLITRTTGCYLENSWILVNLLLAIFQWTAWVLVQPTAMCIHRQNIESDYYTAR